MIIEILRFALLAYILAIFLVIVLSWFPQRPGGPGYQVFVALRRVTDPVLEPVRRILPPVGGMIDLSPTVVLLVLWIVYGLLGG